MFALGCQVVAPGLFIVLPSAVVVHLVVVSLVALSPRGVIVLLPLGLLTNLPLLGFR